MSFSYYSHLGRGVTMEDKFKKRLITALSLIFVLAYGGLQFNVAPHSIWSNGFMALAAFIAGIGVWVYFYGTIRELDTKVTWTELKQKTSFWVFAGLMSLAVWHLSAAFLATGETRVIMAHAPAIVVPFLFLVRFMDKSHSEHKKLQDEQYARTHH